MTPLIVGIDLSLQRTGVCVAGQCDLIVPTNRGLDRLHYISQEVLCAVEGADLIVLEGYSYGSKGRAVFDIAELGGVIRYQLWQQEACYVDVPPATLKKFLTGKGNANKDTMVATAARAGCPADDNNAVDAWALYQLGLYRLGERGLPATAYRDEATLAIPWPELEAA